MSGIEVAGLVFGIVPVVVEILKSYTYAKDRLKSFTHHVQVIHEVQLRYRVAATNFCNDCQLLLKAVMENARELSQMIDEPTHSGWRDPMLEERLRKFLGRDCQIFEEIVVRIREELRATGARLSKLDEDLSAARKESRSMILKRLYTAFDISLKENAYRRSLDDLDQWNTKLSHLRAQRCKLRKQRRYCMDFVIHKSVPKRYDDIRTASQRLHDSLKDSWSCTNLSHAGHQAKLSLNAEAEHGTAQLDMVIACRRKLVEESSKESDGITVEPPIWLHVRSLTTSDLISHNAPRSPAMPKSVSTSLQDTAKPSSTSNPTATPNAVVRKVERTLKRVRFDTSADCGASRSPPRLSAKRRGPNQSSQNTYTMLDLRATSSVCCHLSKACQSTPCSDISLGYLESHEAPHSFRFIFYDAGRKTESNISRNVPGKDSHTIRNKLAKLQTLHQLTLAHKLATTVLQYHSTAWLAQNWGLEDVSYFTEDTSNTTDHIQDPEHQITHTLQTLHLSTQFPSEPCLERESSRGDPEELSYMYGIRNLTLARLGVALLEVGTKKELGSVTLDSSLSIPHQIISARKMLRDVPPSLAMLGKRYIKMARKCIDCDFSCGDDLADEALQSAVYTEVICALESMITDWKRFIGS